MASISRQSIQRSAAIWSQFTKSVPKEISMYYRFNSIAAALAVSLYSGLLQTSGYSDTRSTHP